MFLDRSPRGLGGGGGGSIVDDAFLVDDVSILAGDSVVFRPLFDVEAVIVVFAVVGAATENHFTIIN